MRPRSDLFMPRWPWRLAGAILLTADCLILGACQKEHPVSVTVRLQPAKPYAPLKADPGFSVRVIDGLSKS